MRFHTKCTYKVSLIINKRRIIKIHNWISISTENHYSIPTHWVWQFHNKSRTTKNKCPVTNLYRMWPLSKHSELTHAWKDNWGLCFKSSTTKPTTLPWNSEWDSLLEDTEDKVSHVQWYTNSFVSWAKNHFARSALRVRDTVTTEILIVRKKNSGLP